MIHSNPQSDFVHASQQVNKRTTQRLDANTVKSAAHGRWPEILGAICPELTEALNTSRKVHCPLPLHDDEHPSFRFDKPENGSSICTCGSHDAFKLIMTLRGVTFPESLSLVANHLGIENGTAYKPDLMTTVCHSKRMPIESAKAYGAHLGKRDTKYGVRDVVRFPVVNEQGELHCYFDLAGDGGKGLFQKGKGNSGLFLPVVDDKPRLPAAGETWILCEGVKDAANYHALGYSCCGLPTDNMAIKYARIFDGCNVVLMPDRTVDAEDKAEQSAGRLFGVAASVRIGTLPLEIGGDKGDDARDVLRQAGGDNLLRQAVDDAKEWRPKDTSVGGCVTNVTMVPDGDKTKIVPLTMAEIIGRTKQQTDDWPRRVDGALFVHDHKHGIGWLEKPANLFGWFSSHVGQVKWQTGDARVGRAEYFAELQRTALKYRSIETLPHHPMLDGHYYTCGSVQPGNGETLRKLVGRFAPETPIDFDLITAAFVTPAWGGPSGLRPAFVITSDDGRGSGKTTVAKLVGHLWGGLLSFSHNEDINKIKTRLLSGEAMPKRVCMLDNVKSMRFSWGELEGIITSPEIGGHRMYSGEATRPNNLTWFITLNGASLSTDMAQRSVIVKVKRPQRSANWEEDTTKFIDAHRDALIADCIGQLQAEVFPLEKFTRWATWEKDILRRLPEPAEAQQVILERQAVADAEKDDAELLEEYFGDQLAGLSYDTDAHQVFIPSGVAADWFNRCHNDKQKTGAVSRIINQLIDEGTLHSLQKIGRSWGRGFLWQGKDADVGDPIKTDIDERLARCVA